MVQLGWLHRTGSSNERVLNFLQRSTPRIVFSALSTTSPSISIDWFWCFSCVLNLPLVLNWDPSISFGPPLDIWLLCPRRLAISPGKTLTLAPISGRARTLWEFVTSFESWITMQSRSRSELELISASVDPINSFTEFNFCSSLCVSLWFSSIVRLLWTTFEMLPPVSSVVVWTSLL